MDTLRVNNPVVAIPDDHLSICSTTVFVRSIVDTTVF